MNPGPVEQRERFAERLREAGLSTKRFIDVHDTAKGTTNHTQREPDDSALQGNYGVYGGRGADETDPRALWLVDVDVDDYDRDDGRSTTSEGLDSLPETFTIESPHTDGEVGGHRYFAVRGNVAEALNDALGVENPAPEWGEVRVKNQYVVGPGSQISPGGCVHGWCDDCNGCDKEWCDECAREDGGYYRIADNREIAVLELEEFVEAIATDVDTRDRAIPSPDGGVMTMTGESAGDDDTETPEYTPDPDVSPTDVIETNPWLGIYLAAGATAAGYTANDGSDDRSQADFAACKDFIRAGVTEEDAHGVLNDNDTTKVCERGPEYWSETWSNALTDVVKECEEDGVPLPWSDSDTDGTQAPMTAQLRKATIEAEMEAVGDNPRDRELAYYLHNTLMKATDDAYRFMSATPAGTIYRYNNGVWTDDGKQFLRQLAAEGAGAHYSTGVHTQLVERVTALNAVHVDELGTPARTIATENGLLDLDPDTVPEERLQPLEPEHYALSQLPVEHDHEAEAPRWERYIEESVEEDMRDALQEFAGYCLLDGELPYEKVLLLVGEGSNGKTKFLNVMTELLGTENTTGHALGDLAHSEYHRAELFGKFANIDADITGGIGHGGMFKKLSGGDRKVSARRPYEEPFDFHPTTKQLYSANEVPDAKDDTDAFYRRWVMVEFPRTFTDPGEPGPDKDPELERKLLEELPGILNWAIDGLHRLLEQGHFTNEGSTEEKRRRWMDWGNSIEKFISACIDEEAPKADRGKHTTRGVYARYSAWCHQAGETPDPDQGKLTSAIKTLDGVGYSSSYRFDGVQKRGFKGLAFTAEAPLPDPDLLDDDGEGGDEKDDTQLSLSTPGGETDDGGDSGGDNAEADTDTDGDTGPTIAQRAAVRSIQDTVAELETREEPAPLDAVIDAIPHTEERARHVIQKLLDKGELMSDPPGGDGLRRVT